MPGESGIEWTDATWNPVTGCSKVSAGCKNCYAEAYFARPYPGRKFTDVRIHPERLDWPLHWRGSKQAKAEGRLSRIFVNSMSDLFHEHVPHEFIKAARGTMFDCEKHVFQILTKRPERMKEFVLSCCQFTPNVWLGVSVEDQKTADERIPILLQTPAAVRWVSYEPALGPVDLHSIPDGRGGYYDLAYSQGPGRFNGQGMRISDAKLDWLVAGGESGPRARPPHPDWFRKVRDDCVASGVPFFFKQWGAWTQAEAGGEQKGDVSVSPSGQVVSLPSEYGHFPPRDRMRFVGRKKAGRLLDGREWNEFPQR